MNQRKTLHLWCFSYNHHYMRHTCSVSVNGPDSEGHRVSIRAGCSGLLTLGKGDGAMETTFPSLETPGEAGKDVRVGLGIPHAAPAGTGAAVHLHLPIRASQ